MLLEVPAEVIEAVRLPRPEMEKELLRELALALYQREMLSSGKACLLARMSRWEFEEQLGQRRLTRHYTAEDLDEDMEYARSHL